MAVAYDEMFCDKMKFSLMFLYCEYHINGKEVCVFSVKIVMTWN